MDTNSKTIIESHFPRLASSRYEITSPFDRRYNCIAWAAGDSQRWWEPDPMDVGYWPEGVPRLYTVAAYEQAFESLGYSKSEVEAHEPGFTKVALFAIGASPKHAARELKPSMWTSKLGVNVDISHQLDGLTGDVYGLVVTLLKRPT